MNIGVHFLSSLASERLPSSGFNSPLYEKKPGSSLPTAAGGKGILEAVLWEVYVETPWRRDFHESTLAWPTWGPRSLSETSPGGLSPILQMRRVRPRKARGQGQVHTDRDCTGGDLTNSIIK